MNVCRLLFSITILLTYPIECFICREVIENIIFTQLGFFSEKFNREVVVKENKKISLTATIISSYSTVQSWISHVSITVVVVVITCFVSLSTNCLGIVLILNVRQSCSRWARLNAKIRPNWLSDLHLAYIKLYTRFNPEKQVSHRWFNRLCRVYCLLSPLPSFCPASAISNYLTKAATLPRRDSRPSASSSSASRSPSTESSCCSWIT